jgi:hypothetical protein
MNRDLSDLVTFKFDIINEGKPSERKTGLVTYKQYDVDEEYSYSYSRDLDVVLLMISYGMAFDNSPFAMITIPLSNAINQLASQKLVKVCMILACLDPDSFDSSPEVANYLKQHLSKDSIRDISN